MGKLGGCWTTERLVQLFVIHDGKCDIYLLQLVVQWQKQIIQ